MGDQNQLHCGFPLAESYSENGCHSLSRPRNSPCLPLCSSTIRSSMSAFNSPFAMVDSFETTDARGIDQERVRSVATVGRPRGTLLSQNSPPVLYPFRKPVPQGVVCMFCQAGILCFHTGPLERLRSVATVGRPRNKLSQNLPPVFNIPSENVCVCFARQAFYGYRTLPISLK